MGFFQELLAASGGAHHVIEAANVGEYSLGGIRMERFKSSPVYHRQSGLFQELIQ